jgi:predicted nucleic acid-binding protein
MATYLLDTNIIIDALNGRKNRNLALVDLAQQGHTLACCCVNVAEVYAGMRSKEEARTADVLASLEFYPVSFPVAELAGRLRRDYGRKGKTLSIPDTMIAAVALHYRLALITDNAKDFPMPDLLLHRLPE